MLYFTFKIEGCGISESWFKRSNTNLRPRSLTSSPWKRRDFPLNLERKEGVAQHLIFSRGEILVSGCVNVYHPGSVDGVRHLPLVLAYHGQVPTLRWQGYFHPQQFQIESWMKGLFLPKQRYRCQWTSNIWNHTVMMRMNFQMHQHWLNYIIWIIRNIIQTLPLFFKETSLIPSTFYLRILGSCSHPPYPMGGDVLRSVRRFDSWRWSLPRFDHSKWTIGFTRWRETAILWFHVGFPTPFLADLSSQ